MKKTLGLNRTDIDIMLGVVLELLNAKERGAVVVIRQGNVSTDVLAFNGDNILFGPVLAVPSGVFGPQFPAKAHPLEQVEHGLVFRDF